MSMRFAKQTIKSLVREYGTTSKIILTKYIQGQHDFKNAATNNGVESLIVVGVALPKTLNSVFFQRSTLPYDKKLRPFLIQTSACLDEWVKDGNYLTYLDERYNIKHSDYLEGIYYYVLASSDGDEPSDNT